MATKDITVHETGERDLTELIRVAVPETGERDLTELIRVAVPERSVRADLRAVSIVWRRELIRFRTDRLRAITSLVQPVLFLFVLGTGLSRLAVSWAATITSCRTASRSCGCGRRSRPPRPGSSFRYRT